MRDLTGTREAAIGGLADAEVDRYGRVLREASSAGERGDGRIFVVNVEPAIDHRPIQEKEKAL